MNSVSRWEAGSDVEFCEHVHRQSGRGLQVERADVHGSDRGRPAAYLRREAHCGVHANAHAHAHHAWHAKTTRYTPGTHILIMINL